jgi:fructokinase
MPRFAIVIGEAFVDLIAQKDELGAMIYRPRFGGSPLNVAVGMRRLGASVELASAIADDSFGRQLKKFLASEQINFETLSATVDRTVLAVATPTSGHVTYEYFGDFQALLSIPKLDAQILPRAAVVHAGSTAFMGGPVFSTVVAAFEVQSAFRTMDPNPRPTLIADVREYRERLEAVFGLADLIKFSGEDVEYLYPDATIHDAVARIHERFATPVVVTLAEEPTMFLFEGHVYRIPVPPVKVIDATGAGDSFMASILTDICNRGPATAPEEWRSLITRANTAAGLTCQGVGGAESMPALPLLNAQLAVE